MRHYLATAGLLLLIACGGDDDVTSPPENGNFTLAVSGQGTGSGRVSTDAAVTPAIDCILAGAATPTGVCSGSYVAGTAVGISVTPESGSGFNGWSGDASGCGATLSCSITMDANKSAVAQLTAASAAELQITSSAWYPAPELGAGAVNWVVEVRNNSSQTIEFARVDYTSRDAAGNELASDFTLVGPIPPGETRANEGLAEYRGTEASVDFQLGEVVVAAEDPGLGVAQIVSSNWSPDPSAAEEGGIIWTVEVQNNSSLEIFAQVDFVSYDAAGKILDYAFTFVGPVPPGGRAAGEGFAELHGTEASANYQIAGVTQDDLGIRAPSFHGTVLLKKPTTSMITPTMIRR
jgi:hypothetical protein